LENLWSRSIDIERHRSFPITYSKMMEQAETRLANLAGDLDGGQRRLRFLLLSNPPNHAVGASCRPDIVIG
jgi:hypothetical protein